MYWMTLPLKRYADFSGRSRRREYWMFTLGYVLVFAMLVVVGSATGNFGDDGSGDLGLFFWLFMIVAIALVIPSVAVQVRRFHDQDKSGWFALLGLIPYVGGLIILVFMLIEGTGGPNEYGPDPKAEGGEYDEVFD